MTIEERVARLEEKANNSDEKIDTLFTKMDALIIKLDAFITTVSEIKAAHLVCSRSREESQGWWNGRITKIIDAAFAGGLVFLLFLLLKNAGGALKLLGG